MLLCAYINLCVWCICIHFIFTCVVFGLHVAHCSSMWLCVCVFVYGSVRVCLSLSVSVCLCVCVHLCVCICMSDADSKNVNIPIVAQFQHRPILCPQHTTWRECAYVCLYGCARVCLFICVCVLSHFNTTLFYVCSTQNDGLLITMCMYILYVDARLISNCEWQLARNQGYCVILCAQYTTWVCTYMIASICVRLFVSCRHWPNPRS